MSSISVVLVYNPLSGSIISNIADVRGYFERLVTACQHKQFSIKLYELNRTSEQQLRNELSKIAPDQIWVAGGDGTVLSIAKIAMQMDTVVGVIPCGTMNLLARDLGMPLDIDEAVGQLCNAVVSRVDMAFMNDKPFLNISNAGMSTRLTDRRESLRKHHWSVRWPLMAWYTFRFMFSYPRLTVHLKTGEQEQSFKTRSLTISNNPIAPDSSLLPSRTKLNSGVLGVYVVRDSSVWALPRLILRLLAADWQGDSDLISFESAQISISFTRPKKLMKVMTDGELSLETLPLKYEIKPLALKVLKPEARL